MMPATQSTRVPRRSGRRPARGLARLGLFTLGLAILGCAPARSAPSARFEPAEVDFGVQAPGSTVEATVRVVNTGDVPLTVLRSGTSCGCTTAQDLSGTTIPVGSFVEVPVKMSLKSGLGEKEERLYAMFRELGRDYISVPFRAVAALPVELVPPHLDATESQSGTLQVHSRDGRPFRILSAGGKPPKAPSGVADDFSEARTRHELAWDGTDWKEGADVPWFWLVETDHPGARLIDARVRHESTKPVQVKSRPWQPKDQRLVLGVVRNGETVQATTTLGYGRAAPQAATATAHGDDEKLGVRLVGAAEKDGDLELELEFTPRGLPAGPFTRVIRVGASGAETDLRILGLVEAD